MAREVFLPTPSTVTMFYFLEDVNIKAVFDLFREELGVTDQVIEQVLVRAEYCRLAHASIDEPTGRHSFAGVPVEAIINQTYNPTPGRPQTGRWAFWTAYIIKQDFRLQGIELKHEFSGRLISILLNRSVSVEEVRKVFSEIKKKATHHATAVAKAEGLLYELKHFPVTIRDIQKDLNPDTNMWPMISGGKINKVWLAQANKVRKKILRQLRQGRVDPLVSVASASRFAKALPLSSAPINSNIHLGKGLDVDISTPARMLKEATVEISLNDKPYAAVLYAVPLWQFEWNGLFLARPKPKTEGLKNQGMILSKKVVESDEGSTTVRNSPAFSRQATSKN
jgi:hypothetical protein